MGVSLNDRDRKIIGMGLSVLLSLSMIITYIVSRFNDLASNTAPLRAKIHTPLASDIITFERDHPTLSIYLLGLLICCTILHLTIFTSRRTLYPQGILLQPIIFTSLLVSVSSLSNNPMLLFATLLFGVLGTLEIYSVNHTSYFSSIYSDSPTSVKSPTSRLIVGALYFGILALIQPSAIVLLTLFPIVVFCFDRYFYEMFTPMIVFFIPMFVELYIRWWLYDADFELLFHRYFSLLEPSGSWLTTWGGFTGRIQTSYPVTFMMLFSLLLSGLGLARILSYSITARAHQRFVFSFVLFLVGLFITTMSCFSFEMLTIVAAPVAILITAAMIKLRTWFSVFVFACYIMLTFLAIFL